MIKKYFVNGTHCSSCKILIESELKKLSNVTDAEVSLKKGELEITTKTETPIQTSSLNSLLNKHGYTFHDTKQEKIKLNKNDFLKVLGVFSVFITLFFALENTGLLMKYSVNPGSSVFSYFMLGLIAGISSCAALVGGILLTLSAKWNAVHEITSGNNFKPFIYFNLARVIAFAFFGAVLGILGSAFNISITFSLFFTVVVSLIMLIIGFQMLGVYGFRNLVLPLPKTITNYVTGDTDITQKYMPLVIGTLTFFIPCGFTLIAQTNALSSGSPIQGMLFLLAFSLGTLPLLALISFTSVKLYSNSAFSKKFSLFSGLLISFFALYTLNSQLNALGVISLNDVKSVFTSETTEIKKPILDAAGNQIMTMEAADFFYSPRSIQIKANTPTTWNIYNNGAQGCAQAVYARGLYSDVIYLDPGLNTVEFISPKKGTYKISCSMGMVAPVIVTVY